MLRCKSCQPAVKNPQIILINMLMKKSLRNMMSLVTWWEKINWMLTIFITCQWWKQDTRYKTHFRKSYAIHQEVRTSFSLRSSYLSFGSILLQSRQSCQMTVQSKCRINVSVVEETGDAESSMVKNMLFLIEGQAKIFSLVKIHHQRLKYLAL